MALSRRQEFLDSTPSTKLRLYRNDSVEIESPPPLLEDYSPAGVSLGDFIYPDVVARQACFWGGLVFACIGSIEFFFPAVTGTTATRFHSLFYLVMGAALILPAIVLSPRPLARVSVTLGVALAALGFLGFMVGAPAALDRFHWVLSPGNLEFGTRDHILQEAVGFVLVLVGLRHRKAQTNELLPMNIKQEEL